MQKQNQLLKSFKIITVLSIVWIITLAVNIKKSAEKEYVNFKSVETDSLSYYRAKCQYLEKELLKWEDHAIRMKRIVGIPDTVSWSYKQKVIHNIDTSKLN
jgi:hypothetical protein